jgi:hypothetical protein
VRILLWPVGDAEYSNLTIVIPFPEAYQALMYSKYAELQEKRHFLLLWWTFLSFLIVHERDAKCNFCLLACRLHYLTAASAMFES